MQLIADHPGISQMALIQAVGRDKSTLTPLPTALERRLIDRMPDPADGRGRKLALTEAGLAKLAVLASCARRREERLNAAVGPKRRAQFLRTS